VSEEPVFTPPKDRWLAIVAVLGFIICLCLAMFELSRAFEGNPRSWAYAIEWPVFGAFVIYMWRRLQRERARNEEEDARDGEVEHG